jgi:hypothetical protein
MTFWLALFNVVAWLAIVAMNYALFICIVPGLAIALAVFAMDLPRLLRLNIAWANILQTYGLPIIIVVCFLGTRLFRAFGRFPRWGRAMSVLSMLALVCMAAIATLDSRYLRSFGSTLAEGFLHTQAVAADLQALNATRSVIIAEYRYRELHPKAGFTCDFGFLEPLGGPAEAAELHGRPELNKRTAGVHTLSLNACQGMPVANYLVSAVPDPSFGAWFKNAVAYCSDGSGALYSAADGKSETCLTARTPIH